MGRSSYEQHELVLRRGGDFTCLTVPVESTAQDETPSDLQVALFRSCWFVFFEL
jgi:hypothetical protein